MCEVDVELLINLVHGHAALWDKTIDKYKDRSATKAAWTQVCKCLRGDFDSLNENEKTEFGRSVVTKWNNIRDNWLRSHKRMKEERRYGAKRIRKYIFYDQLIFLKKNYEEEADSNLYLSTTSNDATTTKESDTRKSLEQSTPRNSQLFTKPSANTPSENKRRNKKRNSFSYPNTLPSIPRNCYRETSDTHMSFFVSILPSVSQFNEDETLDFRIAVLNMIKKIKQDARNSDPFQNNSGIDPDKPYGQIIQNSSHLESSAQNFFEKQLESNSHYVIEQRLSPTQVSESSSLSTNEQEYSVSPKRFKAEIESPSISIRSPEFHEVNDLFDEL